MYIMLCNSQSYNDDFKWSKQWDAALLAFYDDYLV